MAKKLPEIKFFSQRSVYTYVYSGHDRDQSSSTYPTRKSIVEFGNTTQVFEDDEFGFKAIRYINELFANDKLKKLIKKC